MNIWLVTIGETVPVGQGLQDRPLRTLYLARLLAQRGHAVTWWTSTFDHTRKKHVTSGDSIVPISHGLTIRLLRGCGYRRNFSLKRWWDHSQIARKFRAYARSFDPRPDVILSALPTVELCAAATEYGRMHGIPTVLDLRDMWPDIWLDAVWPWARWPMRILTAPAFAQARRACADATAIVGITDLFVEWGLQRGCRDRCHLDKAFPLGYAVQPPPTDAVSAGERYWDSQGLHPRAGVLTACYCGALGMQLDLQHVIAAAARLRSQGAQVRFVFAGAGSRLEEYRREAAHADANVLFPGHLDHAQIYVLLRRSHVGLDPLPARQDFLATVNNKAYEYMSAGLPIISSPKDGVLYRLLKQENCGCSYASGDATGLTDLLSELINAPGRLERMSQNAGRLFRSRFSGEAVYTEMATYLEDLAASRNLAAPAPVRGR